MDNFDNQTKEQLIKEVARLKSRIKKLEKIDIKLKESEAKFRALFNNESTVMLIIDPETGKIEEANPAAEKFYGWTREELLKMNLGQINQLSMSEIQGEMQAAKIEKRNHFFFRHKIASGEIREVEVYSGPIEISGKQLLFSVVHDVTERKKAEKKVLEEKNKAQQYLNIASVMLVGINTSGIVQLINPKGCEILGYAEEDILGKNWFDNFIPVRIRERIKAVAKKVFSGEVETAKSYENEILTKSGEERLIAWHNAILRDENGKILGTLSSGEDITERKKAEEEIKKLSLVVQQNTDIVVITDIEGMITYVNPVFCNITGYTGSEVIGQSPGILKSGDKTDDEYHQLWETITSGKIWRGEFLNKKKNGQLYYESAAIFPLRNDNDQIINYVGIKKDITRNKQDELKLKNANARLEMLHELDNAILESRSVDSISNAALERLAQLSRAKRISIALFSKEEGFADVYSRGMLDDELGHGAKVTITDVFPDLKSLREGKAVKMNDMNSEKNLGENLKRIVESGIQSIFNMPIHTGDKLLGSINFGFEKPYGFTSDDIELGKEIADTLAIALEQVRLHNELKQYAEDLEQRVSDRTEELLTANRELESFAYSVSHDLRAPLRAISGFSDIIVESYQDSMNKDAVELFQYIRESARNMSQLIKDLLKFSRMIQLAGKKESINLNDLMQKIIRNLDKEIMEQKAKVILPENHPAIESDRTLLGQVFQNLIQNAITYHKKGIPPIIRLGVKEEKKFLTLSVTDNGIGIPEKYHEKIFEVFKRLHKDEDYPGTGIGLSLVKKAVSKLGGSVNLESTPGEGTTFYVRLPKG